MVTECGSRGPVGTPVWGPLWKKDPWEKLGAGSVSEGADVTVLRRLSELPGPTWDPPEDNASQLAPEAGESFPTGPVRSFDSVFQSL